MGGPTFGQELILLDEHVVLGPIKRIDFVGAGVVATRVGFDGIITITGGGAGSITGSGVAGQVTYWNGVSSITGDPDFTWNDVANVLLFSAGAAISWTDIGLARDSAGHLRITNGGAGYGDIIPKNVQAIGSAHTFGTTGASTLLTVGQGIGGAENAIIELRAGSTGIAELELNGGGARAKFSTDGTNTELDYQGVLTFKSGVAGPSRITFAASGEETILSGPARQLTLNNASGGRSSFVDSAHAALLDYTLPTAIVANGFLKTDAGGVLSWAALTPADFPPGLTGPPGEDGQDGVDGAMGPAGPIGPAGAIGPVGPAGEDGADGVDGGPGPRGLQGIQGIPGSPGVDGEDGLDGATGPQGPRGFTGPAGPGSSLTIADLNDAIDDALSNALIGFTGAPDLTQYLYKPGIAGGQYAYGGTKTSDRLTLDSTTATHTEDFTVGTDTGSYIIAADTIRLKGGAFGTLMKWRDVLTVSPTFMNFAGAVEYATYAPFGIGPIGMFIRTDTIMNGTAVGPTSILNVLPSFTNEPTWTTYCSALSMQIVGGNAEGAFRDSPTFLGYHQGAINANFAANSRYWGFESRLAMGTTVATPAAPAVVASAGGAITVGTHSWKFTYVYPSGLEVPSAASATLNIVGGTQTVTLTVPVGPRVASLGTPTARNIYRTAAGTPGGPWLLLPTNLPDNTSTTFVDAVADASLSTAIPATPTTALTLPIRIGWHFTDAVISDTSTITDQTAFEVPACVAGTNSNNGYTTAITSALAANRAFSDTGGATSSLVGGLIRSQTPTNVTIPTGFFMQYVLRQKWTSTQRLTAQGTARLRGN